MTTLLVLLALLALLAIIYFIKVYRATIDAARDENVN
jgi:hypothetical protein